MASMTDATKPDPRAKTQLRRDPQIALSSRINSSQCASISAAVLEGVQIALLQPYLLGLALVSSAQL